jgi:hypothetical protein
LETRDARADDVTTGGGKKEVEGFFLLPSFPFEEIFFVS